MSRHYAQICRRRRSTNDRVGTNDPSEGATRWMLRLLARRTTELGYVTISAPSPWVSCYRKRTPAVAREVLVHQFTFGTYLANLSTVLRQSTSGRLSRGGKQGTAQHPAGWLAF